MPPEKAPLGSPARLQAPSQRLAVATTFFRAVDGAWSGWAKGLAFMLPFWRWWKIRRKGGRRRDAKRPEKRGAGGFASGPRFLFGRPRGGPGGRPSAAKRRRPREAAPAFSLSPGNRRRAGGGALGNGERVAVGLRGGRRRFAGPKGPQNQSGGGGQRPPPMLCARCARPPPPWGDGIFHRPNDPSTNPFRPGFQQRNLARRSR